MRCDGARARLLCTAANLAEEVRFDVLWGEMSTRSHKVCFDGARPSITQTVPVQSSDLFSLNLRPCELPCLRVCVKERLGKRGTATVACRGRWGASIGKRKV